MTRAQIVEQIKKKQSFLCVGLDTDIHKIPKHLLKYDNPVLEFNKQIIDATADLCISFKINTAFYECQGLTGWQALTETWKYLPADVFSIADAKRGDIGNTSSMYAKAFFDEQASGMGFHSVTVAPYMGKDSVAPFLEFKNKWVILLALTSNEGSKDFQILPAGDKQLFEQVLETSQQWGDASQMMYVVGATRGELFREIRKYAPDHFLLVPGVGAQGGSLSEVCQYGMNKDCGLIVNSSRAIIYASSGENFAEAARAEALKVQQEMAEQLKAISF